MFKKSILFLFLCTLTLSAFTQYSGALTISSNAKQKFWLFIDDVLQNEYSTFAIQLQGLQFTHYRVRVEMDNRDNNCVGQTILISTISNSNNYIINTDKNNYFFMKSNTRINPFFIQSVITPNKNYYSYYQQYLYPGFNPTVNYGQGNQYRGNQYAGYQQYYQNGGYKQGGYQGYPPVDNYSGQAGFGNSSNTHPTQGMCMPAFEFNKALTLIISEDFENSKLSTAKQVALHNHLCVNQIIQICRHFDFEKSKLDFAKYAYSFCIDKHYYYMLNEVFDFNASKDDLRKFIERR